MSSLPSNCALGFRQLSQFPQFACFVCFAKIVQQHFAAANRTFGKGYGFLYKLLANFLFGNGFIFQKLLKFL